MVNFAYSTISLIFVKPENDRFEAFLSNGLQKIESKNFVYLKSVFNYFGVEKK